VIPQYLSSRLSLFPSSSSLWSNFLSSLITNYCRSVDVLKIIAKVLSFTDEQLVVVGLKVPPIDLLSSIVTTVIGKPVAKEVPV